MTTTNPATNPDPACLVQLAVGRLRAADHPCLNEPDLAELAAATTAALVAIAASLDQLATRYAPELSTLRTVRDDR